MNPELYKKILEHNTEAISARNKLSIIGLIASPILVFIGVMLLIRQPDVKSSWDPIFPGGFFKTKLPTALIISGLYFGFVSIRWRFKGGTKNVG